MSEQDSNPRSPTFQAGSFNHCTRAPPHTTAMSVSTTGMRHHSSKPQQQWSTTALRHRSNHSTEAHLRAGICPPVDMRSVQCADQALLRCSHHRRTIKFDVALITQLYHVIRRALVALITQLYRVIQRALVALITQLYRVIQRALVALITQLYRVIQRALVALITQLYGVIQRALASQRAQKLDLSSDRKD